MSKFIDDLTKSKNEAQARQAEVDNEASKFILERARTIMSEQASNGRESCVVGSSEKRIVYHRARGRRRPYEWKLEFSQ